MNKSALSTYFADAAIADSVFGKLDCVRFVIEALYVGWGTDFRDVLGYSDRKTACARLRLSGGLEQAFTDELGDPVAPTELKTGDIAYFEDPGVGLVMDSYVAVKFGNTIGRVPLQFVSKGWKTWVQS